jgi:hypothetical protein
VSNTNLEAVLQKIDAKVCSTLGDYTGYNFSCLINDGPINNEQQFVEKISSYVCQTRSSLDTFISTTYPSGINGLQTQINSLKSPGITSCSSLNILSSDTQNIVLTKLSNAVCSIFSSINPASANWSQCFALVGNPPSNIVEGFNAVLSQICTIKNSGGSAVLPTFDNTGSCLSNPTGNDSLVDTISKIKTRLCSTPTFNAGNITAGTCISFTSSDSLETIISETISQVDTVSKNAVTDTTSDFTLVNVDNSNPCLGKKLGLNLANIDRKVGLNSSDLTPGTLADKIVQGTNISLDFGNTNPGKLTISSTAAASNDEKVKATSFDTTAGYLDVKIIGNTDIVSVAVTPVNNSTQLKLSSNLDYEGLIDIILDTIADNETLKEKFCNLISSCPSPCQPPTNVQIINA